MESKPRNQHRDYTTPLYESSSPDLAKGLKGQRKQKPNWKGAQREVEQGEAGRCLMAMVARR